MLPETIKYFKPLISCWLINEDNILSLALGLSLKSSFTQGISIFVIK